MKRPTLLPLLLLFVAVANAPAEPLGDAAEVTPATGWYLTKNDRPSPFPTITYRAPAGRKATVLLSLLPAARLGVTDAASLRKIFPTICRPYLPSPDFPVRPTDLQLTQGIGIYATFVDPALAGKPAGPGDYKTATSACVFLGGDVLVHATLLCDDPASRDFSEGLDMVRGIAAVATPGAKTASRPPAPPAPKPPRVSTAPIGPLTLVPPAGFTDNPLKLDTRPGYFSYLNAEGIVLSGWLDQASKFHGMRTFWAAEKAVLEKDAGRPIRNDTIRLVGGWSVVSYEEQLGPSTVQKNLRACKTQGGTWADVHLSGVGDRVTVAALEAILTQIKLEPAGAK